MKAVGIEWPSTNDEMAQSLPTEVEIPNDVEKFKIHVYLEETYGLEPLTFRIKL